MGQSFSNGLHAAAQFVPIHYLDLLTSGDTSLPTTADRQNREDSMGWNAPYQYRQDDRPDEHSSSTSHDRVYVHPSSWDEPYLPPPSSPNIFEAMQREEYGLEQQQQQQHLHNGAPPTDHRQSFQQQQLHYQNQLGRYQDVHYINVSDSDDWGEEEENLTAASDGEEVVKEEEAIPGPVDIGREHDHEVTWPTRWTREQKNVIYTVVRDIVAEGKEYKNVHNMYSQMRKKVNNGQAMTLYYGTDEEKVEIASMFRRYKVQRPDWYIDARREDLDELLATHRSIFGLKSEATRSWFYRCTSVANARRMLQRARLRQEDLKQRLAQRHADEVAEAARLRAGGEIEQQ